MVVLGCLLIGVAIVLSLLDWDGLAARMPTQVPPRSLAVAPLLIGVALVAIGLLT